MCVVGQSPRKRLKLSAFSVADISTTVTCGHIYSSMRQYADTYIVENFERG
jgi:hypothetical protein